ncbi:MAG: hypothetical protein AUG44_28190 [Actinobacteria bacterium 13_1_20CM_3_71_11]|nr:MAG: hypothetical protein AUG44_28190 [Actinobacteria bacterium 13_1_20CM_3_71_11]
MSSIARSPISTASTPSTATNSTARPITATAAGPVRSHSSNRPRNPLNHQVYRTAPVNPTATSRTARPTRNRRPAIRRPLRQTRSSSRKGYRCPSTWIAVEVM